MLTKIKIPVFHFLCLHYAIYMPLFKRGEGQFQFKHKIISKFNFYTLCLIFLNEGGGHFR